MAGDTMVPLIPLIGACNYTGIEHLTSKISLGKHTVK